MPQLTILQANTLIDELRKKPVPANSEPEDLLRRLETNIDVVQHENCYRVQLTADGKVASWLTIFDYQQRVGGALLRLGAIAGVGTDDHYRFRGLSRRVIVNALRWMRQQGFDVTMLFGIPSFYPKFGFTPVLPNVSASIAVRDAEDVVPTGYRIVNYEKELHDANLLAMYHANNARRTGTILRDPAAWSPRHGSGWNTKSLWKLVLDRRGRPAGYFAHDSAYPAVTLLEVGFATPAIFPDVLRFVAEMALAQRVEKIAIALPEDHEFIAFCKPLGISVEQRYRRDGGAMVRMIYAASTLRKLAPVIGPRLKGKGRLTLITNSETVSLSWSGKQLAVADGPGDGANVSLPQWALAQMIYGYRKPSALAGEGVIKAPARALAILERIFPLQAQYFYSVDEF